MLRPEKLNHAKTREMVVRRPRSRPIVLPPSMDGIEMVQEMVILGVTISDRIGFGAHIDKICCKARQSMFALRVLVSHGLHGQRLFDVVRATTLARLLYASPVWWGFATVGERKRLNGIVRKLTRSGFLPADVHSFDSHCSRANSTLFRSILSNFCHVLHDLPYPVRSLHTIRGPSHMISPYQAT